MSPTDTAYTWLTLSSINARGNITVFTPQLYWLCDTGYLISLWTLRLRTCFLLWYGSAPAHTLTQELNKGNKRSWGQVSKQPAGGEHRRTQEKESFYRVEGQLRQHGGEGALPSSEMSVKQEGLLAASWSFHHIIWLLSLRLANRTLKATVI